MKMDGFSDKPFLLGFGLFSEGSLCVAVFQVSPLLACPIPIGSGGVFFTEPVRIHCLFGV